MCSENCNKNSTLGAYIVSLATIYCEIEIINNSTIVYNNTPDNYPSVCKRRINYFVKQTVKAFVPLNVQEVITVLFQVRLFVIIVLGFERKSEN